MAVVKKSMSSIAVLISGNGSNLQAIIDAVISGQLNADINVVISDQPDAYGLQRAKQAGLQCVVCEPQKGMTREQYDAMLQDVLQRYEVDLVVLSGFMRIVSPSIVQYFWGRMINIHPSLLPKYPGLGTHQKVLAEGEKEHGCCVHFVTEELDAGPVMAYAQLQVLPEDTVDSLKGRVHVLEHQLYWRVIELVMQGVVYLKGNQAYFGENVIPKSGLQLPLGD